MVSGTGFHHNAVSCVQAIAGFIAEELFSACLETNFHEISPRIARPIHYIAKPVA
jgi:hypothetical protein